MLLVGFQVFDYVLLLAQFGIEELRIRFELIGEALLWLIQEFGFVGDSLQESVEDLGLDVVVVVLPLIIAVVVENLFDLALDPLFLLIQVHDNIVEGLRLLGVDGFNLLHF